MKIIDKKITELKVYENNPRNNDEAVEAVAESIKQFGFKVPIIIDKDGVIIAGHTRRKAAEKLGLETVPCIVADDLTPEKIKAFRLADNKTGELATWDLEKLEKELAELSEMELDFSMSDFNFDDIEKAVDGLPDELELNREEIGVSHNAPSLKYGTTVIYMTEDEDKQFDELLKDYLTENGTLYGFVSFLMEGK